MNWKTIALAAVMAVAQLPSARAVDVYWDTNGATTGATTSGTANGTWNAASTANWTTDVNGESATSTYATAHGGDPANADVFFSAGTNAILSANITLSGAVVARSITVQELMSFTSGASTPSLTIGSGGVTYASTVAGTSTWISTVPVTLSDSQAWNNQSGFLWTVNGAITGPASTSGTLSVTGTGAGGLTLSGSIVNGAGGSLALVVNTSGGGVTTLGSGASTFSGGVTLTQGILRAAQSGATGTALGSGTLTLAGGEFQVSRSGNSNGTTYTNPIVVTNDVQITSIRNSGTNGINHNLGTLSIGNQTLTVAGDPLSIGGTSSITIGATTLTGSSTFDVVNAPTVPTRLTLGALSGSGTMTKTGEGTLTVGSAAVGFSGPTNIHEGLLVVSNSAALGSGTVFLGRATGNDNATLSVTLGNATIGNNIVVAENSGTATFRIINPSAASNTAVTYGGTLTLNGDLTVAPTSGGGNMTFANSIVGSGTGAVTLTNEGTGTITFATSSTLGAGIDLVQNAGTMIISGTNTAFDGSITINGGTVTASTIALAGGGNLISVGASGTFTNSQGNSTPVVIAGLADGTGGGGTVTQNASNRFISIAGSGTYSFSGAITIGGLNKTGPGTQILSGNNSLSATTTVSAGTLRVDGQLGVGAVNVNGGVLAGSGTMGGIVTIATSGTLSPGSSPGTLTINNNLNMQNGSTYVFEGGDLVDVNGQLDLDNNWTLSLGAGFMDGGSVTLFTYDTLAASPDLVPTFDIAGLGFTPGGALSLTDTGSSIVLNGIMLIPEPSTVLLLGMGTMLLLRVRRHREG